jgi:hypothetical protein
VYKRVDTPEFHNIHYVREMLFQVTGGRTGCGCDVVVVQADTGWGHSRLRAQQNLRAAR